MSPELQALQDADFGWVRSLDSVWSDEATDAGPNEESADDIITELARLTQSPNPPDRVFLNAGGDLRGFSHGLERYKGEGEHTRPAGLDARDNRAQHSYSRLGIVLRGVSGRACPDDGEADAWPARGYDQCGACERNLLERP